MEKRKSIARFVMSSHIFSHNFGRDGAAFCRMDLNGARLAVILALAMKNAATICPSPLQNARRVFFTNVRIAAAILLGSAGFAARLRVWRAAENITAAISIRGFD